MDRRGLVLGAFKLNGEALQPYYVGRPLAAVAFYAAIGLLVVLHSRQRFHTRKDATKADERSLSVIGVSMLLSFLLAGFCAEAFDGAALPVNLASFAVGIVLMWAGILLRWWCFRTLGNYFTFVVMTSSDQRVVNSGPYSVVRHPSYTGLLMFLIGVPLVVFTNWASLLVVAVGCTAPLVYRMRVEEAALTSALGDAYTSYAAGRKRLIPFVW